MKKKITIQIDTEGMVHIEGNGFVGQECDKKMAAFEKELGQVKGRKNSPEYNQTVKTTVQQKAGA